MSENPLISVLCASFNHEKYVGYFIQSLINQTYSNWELIIVDDCSSDSNVDQIKKYCEKDKRIHLFQQDFNQGPGAALNRAFKESKGEIIVEIASDDSVQPEYFSYLIKTYSEKPAVGVVYSSVNVIDDDNKKYDEWLVEYSSDRIELLRQLFYQQNIILSPGLSVRREIYNSIIPMDVSMIQHQDYQWHILFLSKAECHIADKSYVNYRSMKEKGISLGSHSVACDNRMKLEINRLMDSFLQIKDLAEIKKITGSSLCDKIPADCYEFIWGYEALSCPSLDKRQWGYNLISKVYADEKLRTQLYKSIDFKFADFLALAKINYYKEDSFFQRKIKGLKKRLNKIFRGDR